MYDVSLGNTKHGTESVQHHPAWAQTGVFRLHLPQRRRDYYLTNVWLFIENKLVYKRHFTTIVISAFIDFPKLLTQET